MDEAGLAEILRPRDDIVRERALGPTEFGIDEGPFTTYTRTVVVEAPREDGLIPVTETIDYHLAIPYFGIFFAIPVRRAMKRFRRFDGVQPWWAPPQRLDVRAAAVMGTISAAAVLAGYLGTLISQTLTFIADEFDVDRSGQGVAGAVVRLGVVASLAVVAVADRRGRRKVAMAAAVGGIAASVAGAASPSLAFLVGSQMTVRMFAAALGTVILVYAVEEMPAGARAYALSLLGMSSALGAGMVLWVLPAADLGRRGWRIVYVVPVLALPLLRDIARRLPESRRFMTTVSRPPPSEGLGSRSHLPKLLVLGAISFLIAAFLSPADQFRNEFLRDERGFNAGTITLFVTLAGTPGGLGLLIGGRAADVVGRKLVILTAGVVGLGFLVLVFNTAGPLMWVLAVVASVISAALLPSLGVYRGELFPNRFRSRAAGWISVMAVAGSVSGLVVAGRLADRWSGIGPVMAVLWIAPLVAVVLVLLLLPETSRRELEDLNPEDAGPPTPTQPGHTTARPRLNPEDPDRRGSLPDG